jgi:16S rRNA (uracil1498-N3)-methyltransferase
MGRKGGKMAQTRRRKLQAIEAPVTLTAYLKQSLPELVLIPTLSSPGMPLATAVEGKRAHSAAVFIGPEGDFTESEVRAAMASGAVPVSLGNLVMRTETAAIYALSVLRFLYPKA